MTVSRAIVFTHIGVPLDKARDIEGAKDLVDEIVPYFRAYLRCRNIGLVYVYIDAGIRMAVEEVKRTGRAVLKVEWV